MNRIYRMGARGAREVRIIRIILSILFILSTLVSCAPAPQWIDVPSTTVDPQAVAHNERACAERGLVFDLPTWSCR